nr:J339 [uncultured bacterium]
MILSKVGEIIVMNRGRHFPLALLLLTSLCLTSPSVNAQPESAATPQRDGQHDFDFEFGGWKAHISRLLKPLTGSKTWMEYDGTSVVRKVWDGRANLGELNVSGPQGHIQGLSLRTYNPQSHQWHIGWVNSADGTMGPPMIGGFKNGRGEFYNQESFNGRAIFVRFIFSDITANSFQIEQAFSDDGGKTWEANWIAKFSRVKG